MDDDWGDFSSATTPTTSFAADDDWGEFTAPAGTSFVEDTSAVGAADDWSAFESGSSSSSSTITTSTTEVPLAHTTPPAAAASPASMPVTPAPVVAVDALPASQVLTLEVIAEQYAPPQSPTVVLSTPQHPQPSTLDTPQVAKPGSVRTPTPTPSPMAVSSSPIQSPKSDLAMADVLTHSQRPMALVSPMPSTPPTPLKTSSFAAPFNEAASTGRLASPKFDSASAYASPGGARFTPPPFGSPILTASAVPPVLPKTPPLSVPWENNEVDDHRAPSSSSADQDLSESSALSPQEINFATAEAEAKEVQEKEALEKQEKAAQEKEAQEKEAQDKEAQEKAAQEKEAQETAALEQAALEQAALEQVAQEKAAQEKAAQETTAPTETRASEAAKVELTGTDQEQDSEQPPTHIFAVSTDEAVVHPTMSLSSEPFASASSLDFDEDAMPSFGVVPIGLASSTESSEETARLRAEADALREKVSTLAAQQESGKSIIEQQQADLAECSARLEEVQTTADELQVIKESQTRLLDQQKALIGKQAEKEEEHSALIARLEQERASLEKDLAAERSRIEELLSTTQSLEQAKKRLEGWKEESTKKLEQIRLANEETKANHAAMFAKYKQALQATKLDGGKSLSTMAEAYIVMQRQHFATHWKHLMEERALHLKRIQEEREQHLREMEEERRVHRESMAVQEASLRSIFEQMAISQQEHSQKLFDHLRAAEERQLAQRETDKQNLMQLQEAAVANLREVASEVIASHATQAEDRARRRAALRLLLEDDE